MIRQQNKEPKWQLDRLIGLTRDQIALHKLMLGGRLHPVILLEGRQGAGKRHLAIWLASRWLCEAGLSKDSPVEPCGKCVSCKEVLMGSHLDLAVLDEAGGAIKTASAELFQEHFNVLSSSGKRIGIIMNADCLTSEAANRLLKTLEEPPSQAIIILTTSRPLSLPATILGRCLRWRLRPPPRAEILEWTKCLLAKKGQADVDLKQLTRFVQRVGFSPGRIYSSLEQDSRLDGGISDDICDLLSASSMSQVISIASDLARTKKVKLAEVLNCAELELSSIYRNYFKESRAAEDRNSLNVWVSAGSRRKALHEARINAVRNKVVLNSQLVMESLGTSCLKEGQ